MEPCARERRILVGVVDISSGFCHFVALNFQQYSVVEIGDLHERRQFLTSSLAASAFALAGKASDAQVASNGTPREYYELRQYHMQNGPQTKLTDAYVRMR